MIYFEPEQYIDGPVPFTEPLSFYAPGKIDEEDCYSLEITLHGKLLYYNEFFTVEERCAVYRKALDRLYTLTQGNASGLFKLLEGDDM